VLLDRSLQLAMIDLNTRALTESVSALHREPRTPSRRASSMSRSLAAFVPGPSMAVYHATKAYALSLSEALHQELKPKGIKVTVLCPGPVKDRLSRAVRDGRRPLSAFPGAFPPGAVAQDGYNGSWPDSVVVIPGSAQQGRGRSAAHPTARNG